MKLLALSAVSAVTLKTAWEASKDTQKLAEQSDKGHLKYPKLEKHEVWDSYKTNEGQTMQVADSYRVLEDPSST